MTEPALGIWFLPLDVPRDHAALADAVWRFYEESGLVLDRISLGIGGRSAGRALRERTVREKVHDPAVNFISLLSEKDRSWISCYLRPYDPRKQEFQPREGDVVSPQLPLTITPAVRTFLDALARLYPLAQAAIAAYRSITMAGLEANSGAFSASDADPATYARLHDDAMRAYEYPTKLRRLYPVTLIGPQIWSQLPPMPKLDRPPIIEELGDCKLVTAWPELVEPLDPAFLAGTVELRRWLWPYTIQNPADAVGITP